MNWIDYIIIISIALSIITGFFRGFAKELMAIIIWCISLWLAINYWNKLADYLQPYLHDQTARMVVSFIAIILIVFILGGFVNLLLNLILNRSGLTNTDRVLGMGFGLLRGVFIVSLVILVLNMTGMKNSLDTYFSDSYLYKKFDPIVAWMNQFTPRLMQYMNSLDTEKSLNLRADP